MNWPLVKWPKKRGTESQVPEREGKSKFCEGMQVNFRKLREFRQLCVSLKRFNTSRRLILHVTAQSPGVSLPSKLLQAELNGVRGRVNMNGAATFTEQRRTSESLSYGFRSN